MDGIRNISSTLSQPVSWVASTTASDADQKAGGTLRDLLEKYPNGIKHIESPYPDKEILEELIQCAYAACNQSGMRGIGAFFSDWPEDKKGKYWFSTLCHFIFSNPDDSGLHDALDRIIRNTDPDQTPQAIYRSVLITLLENRGYLTCDDFIKFMDWLVQWNVFDHHPCPELLKKVPARQGETRPDLPDDVALEQKIMPRNCCNEGCWGGRNKELEKEYLPHTLHTHHAAMLAFLDHAPTDYLLPLLDHWLNAPCATPVRNALFTPRQHPLSTTWNEPRPANILLAVLKRVMPELKSDYLQVMQQLENPTPTHEGFEEHLQNLGAGAQKEVFGRTVGLLKNQGNVYLKFQAGNESDEEFLKQASRYRFAFENGKAMGLCTELAEVAGVFRVENIKETLARLSLSRKEQAIVFMKSISKTLYSISEEIFDNDTYISVLCYGNRYHSTSFVDESLDGPLLTRAQRRGLASYLIETANRPCLAMMLKTSADWHNEKYVYQAKSPDQALQDLTAFAHDFACLYRLGIMGPDICSAFHSFSQNRAYYFLPPLFHQPSVGSVSHWGTLSTDFPNAGCGPFIMRDMGDMKSAREMQSEMYIHETDPAIIRNCHQLHSLARAIWGAILLYGRVNKSRFDHTSDACVASVKSDIGQLLSTFFTHAFGIEEEKCRKLLEQNDLLTQTAREMTYWMSANYVADVRNGEIPASVYPHYAGRRAGLYLCDNEKKSLEDDGFRGGSHSVHLGSNNGRNPILALDSLVVLMLSHGCLQLVKERSSHSSVSAKS